MDRIIFDLDDTLDEIYAYELAGEEVPQQLEQDYKHLKQRFDELEFELEGEQDCD